MKIRRDFVTNSSSSSFIVYYKNPEELVKDMEQFVNNYEDDDYSHQYMSVVRDIFKNKISYEYAIKKIEEYSHIKSWGACSNNKDKIKEYGGYKQWIESEEFAIFRYKYEESELKEFKEKVSEMGFFTYLYYSDSDGYYDVTKNLQNMLKGLCFKIGE